MATAIGTPYSPPSPPDTSSSATMSPVYPDRPIRPLPRRSIRARLSPEVADQIPFPTAPQPSNTVFNHYKDAMAQRNGANITNVMQEVDKVLPGSQSDLEVDGHDGYRFKGNPVDSDDDSQMNGVRHLEDYQLQPGIMPMPGRGSINGPCRPSDSMSRSVASSNDSGEGYDSFENTNNKKKRKIPTSGSIGSHHTSLPASLSNDMANVSISGSRDPVSSPDGSGDGAGQYYGSGSSAVPVSSSGTGISGAGRGRYGRPPRREAAGRSPLGVSTGNSSNGWQAGRLSGTRRDYPGGSLNKAAIAEAAVLPITPSKGRENVSLLDQSSSKKSTTTNTQFTFTCESDSSKGMVWPGENQQPYPGAYPSAPEGVPAPPSQAHHNQKGFSTQGTQTSPTMASQQGHSQAPPGQSQQPAPPAPKPRRPAAKRYAMAERQRKLQQQYQNYHHPPREEDIWICEFCEYESIFGVPPIALVRQYEIKDSRERKRLAEKRRLLEKAKMKGRKGKKGTKNSAKNQNAAAQQQQQPAQHNHGQQYDDPVPANDHGTQSDDYYAEDYEDEIPEPMPPQREVPSRIPRPVAHHNRQTPQVAQSNGT